MSVSVLDDWTGLTVGAPTGSASISAGPRRLLWLVYAAETGGTHTFTSITVGGVSPTGSLLEESTASPDNFIWSWYWDEAAIAAMSGTTITLTKGGTPVTHVWDYIVFQGAGGAPEYATSVEEVSSNDTAITAASETDIGDFIAVAINRSASARDVTDYDTLTEGDQYNTDFTVAVADGKGGDDTTDLTGDGFAGDWLVQLLHIKRNDVPGIVKSVEYLTFDYNEGDVPVTTNLTESQDPTQCVPFWTKHLPDNGGIADEWRERIVKMEIIDNGGTPAVLCSADDMAGTEDYRLHIFVVEFNAGINVQQVAAVIADTATSADISITDVGDQDTAFFMHSYQFVDSTGEDSPDSGVVRAIWDGSATDSITIDRINNVAEIDGVLYVVDCDHGEFTVDHYEFAGSEDSSNEDTDQAITEVVLTDTFVVHSYNTDEGGDDPKDGSFIARLTSATNVQASRSLTRPQVGSDTLHQVQVVECQNNEWFISHRDEYSSSGNNPEIAIDPVVVADSIIMTGNAYSQHYCIGPSDLASGNNVDNYTYGWRFTDAVGDELSLSRGGGGENGSPQPFAVIEFNTIPPLLPPHEIFYGKRANTLLRM
jgi:hypothetical protein